MNQLSMWRPDDPVASFAQSQAKIDVVESDCQIFIKSSNLYIGFPSHQRASSGHRRNILHKMRPSKVTWLEASKANVGVTSDTTCPDNHTAVLDRAVWVPKSC